MSGSSLAASQAYGSVTLSPWKVRTDGTCLARGGASVWRVVGSALMSPSLLSTTTPPADPRPGPTAPASPPGPDRPRPQRPQR